MGSGKNLQRCEQTLVCDGEVGAESFWHCALLTKSLPQGLVGVAACVWVWCPLAPGSICQGAGSAQVGVLGRPPPAAVLFPPPLALRGEQQQEGACPHRVSEEHALWPLLHFPALGLPVSFLQRETAAHTSTLPCSAGSKDSFHRACQMAVSFTGGHITLTYFLSQTSLLESMMPVVLLLASPSHRTPEPPSPPPSPVPAWVSLPGPLPSARARWLRAVVPPPPCEPRYSSPGLSSHPEPVFCFLLFVQHVFL